MVLRNLVQSLFGESQKVTNSHRPVRKFESLEQRNMLTAISFDDATGEIEIDGTENGDYVMISFDSNSGQTIVTELDSFDNPIQTHQFSEATQISADLGDGNDVIFNLTSIPMTVDAGNGNDVVFGGSGDDFIETGNSDFSPNLVDPANLDITMNGLDALHRIQSIVAAQLPGDVAFGGAGNDQLLGDDGTQILFGGDGNDLLVGGEGSDILLGQGGADDIEGGDGNDILVGGNGEDMLAGQAGDDAIYGQDAHGNTIVNQILNDTSEQSEWHGEDDPGESRQQRLVEVVDQEYLQIVGVDPGFDVEDLPVDFTIEMVADFYEPREAHVDEVFEVREFRELYFVYDVLLGGNGDDFLQGGWGDDYLGGGDGADWLEAGAGMDTLFGGDNPEMVYTGPLPSNPIELQLVAAAQYGADVLIASEEDSEHDALLGGQGSDILITCEHKDRVFGGEGDDILGPTSNSLSVYLHGNSGNDLLIGSPLNDVLFGGTGADRFYSGLGDDHIYGDADFVGNGFVKEEDLWMDGASNGNSNDYSEWVSAPFMASLDAGVLTITGSEASDSIFVTQTGPGSVLVHQYYKGGWNDAPDEISDLVIESVFKQDSYSGVSEIVMHGLGSADRLVSLTDIPSQIFGGDDRDKLVGGEGNDLIEGGEGDDEIWGRDGTDQLKGQAGDDKIYGGNNPFAMTGYVGTLDEGILQQMELLEGGEGNDLLFGGAGSDLIAGLGGDDHLEGGLDNDILFVDWLFQTGDGAASGNNWAHGGEGDDWIYGGAGADELSGDSGNDYIEGRLGDDALMGGDGADELRGNGGNDKLYSGGPDSIESGTELLLGGPGHDYLISDHDAAEMRGGDGDDWINAWQGAVASGDNGLDMGFGQAFQDESELTDAVNQLYSEGEDALLIWQQNHNAMFGTPGEILIAMTTNLNGGSSDANTESNDETPETETDSSGKSAAPVTFSLKDGKLTVKLDDAGRSIRFVESRKGVHLQRLDSKGNILEEHVFAEAKTIHVIGGKGNDVIRNDSALSSIQEGMGGDDHLIGGANIDELFGGWGNDILDGGLDAAVDLLAGGPGRDLFYIRSNSTNTKSEAEARDEVVDYLLREDEVKWLFEDEKKDNI